MTGRIVLVSGCFANENAVDNSAARGKKNKIQVPTTTCSNTHKPVQQSRRVLDCPLSADIPLKSNKESISHIFSHRISTQNLIFMKKRGREKGRGKREERKNSVKNMK